MDVEEVHDLSSLLFTSDDDYLIRNNGDQVKNVNFEGKIIGLYFTGRWCPLCCVFLPKLVKAYKEINSKNDEFEVVFVSCDRDQDAFDGFFAEMPWLALPFGDERKASLISVFGVKGVPTLIAIGSTGKIITKDARRLVADHGANGFPFTDERLKEIKEEKKNEDENKEEDSNNDTENENEDGDDDSEEEEEDGDDDSEEEEEDGDDDSGEEEEDGDDDSEEEEEDKDEEENMMNGNEQEKEENEENMENGKEQEQEEKEEKMANGKEEESMEEDKEGESMEEDTEEENMEDDADQQEKHQEHGDAEVETHQV